MAAKRVQLPELSMYAIETVAKAIEQEGITGSEQTELVRRIENAAKECDGAIRLPASNEVKAEFARLLKASTQLNLALSELSNGALAQTHALEGGSRADLLNQTARLSHELSAVQDLKDSTA